MEKFRNLNLSKSILKAIEDENFKEPTEIQEKTIPLVLAGKDVLGSSATGSGKTLAFGAGIMDRIEKGRGIQALVLTPTRELAEQVASKLRDFSKHFGLNVKEVYGGVSIGPQIGALRKSEIVVGTPGRLLDHLERRTIDLKSVKFLILDEADRMLEMGFIDDVEKIIRSCPRERQTLLFSATISQDIERIARKYMKDPVNVEVENHVDPSKLKQVFYDVPQDQKFSLIVHLLKKEESKLVMVFCNTRRNTDMVVKNLKRYGLQAKAIHGGLNQNKRTDIIREFHANAIFTLVCTDVAARGLDIKNISHIYNYDIPKNSTEYIHRIGRTARAGKEGIAVSLVSPRDYENFRNVNQDSSLKIENCPLPVLETLNVSFKSYNNDRSFGGGRGGGFRGGSRDRGRSFGGRERSYSGGGGRSFGRGGRSFDRGERRSFGGRERSSGRGGRGFGGRDNQRSSFRRR